MVNVAVFLLGIFFVSVDYLSHQDEFIHIRLKNHVKSEYHRHKNQKIRPHYEKIEAHCPGAKQKMEEAVDSFEQCIVEKIDDSLTLCSMAETFIFNCTVPINKVIDDCLLSEKEKGLTSLVTESVYSVIKYLCSQTGEALLELNRDCIWNDLQEEHYIKSNKELQKCEERIKTESKKLNKNLTPPRACHFFKGFRNCIDLRITLTCPNNVTRNSFMGLYDAITAPCSHFPSSS